MNWRRRDAPLRGLTFVCATVLFFITVTSHPKAAETEFGYSAGVTETYNGDVLRIGTTGEPQSDFITTLSVPVNLNWRTPRSVSVINYSPEYLKFATFDELDGLNHRLSGVWNMTPGPRSAVGVRVAYSLTNQQDGFQSSPGTGGNPNDPPQNDPILQLTRRISWDISPFHRIDIGRLWSMETRLSYRSQEFENPTLTDVATAGLSYSANARVGGTRRVGGLVRYGRNFFDRPTLTTTSGELQDEVINVEGTYSQQKGTAFQWNAGLGFFKVVGDDRPASGAPTLNATANWNLDRSSIQAGFNLGFSTVAGSTGTAQTQSANFAWSRRWGLRFTTRAAGNYVRFETLVNDPVERYLDGYSIDLQAAYSWPPRWGFAFLVRRLVQEQSSGRSLDYILASIGFTFTPDRPSGGSGRP